THRPVRPPARSGPFGSTRRQGRDRAGRRGAWSISRQAIATLLIGGSSDKVPAVRGVVGHLEALDRDPGQRLLRVLVADYADNRLGRRGHVSKTGRVVGSERVRFAVFAMALGFRQFDVLSRPRQDLQKLAGDGWPVELRSNEAVAADAGEPEAALGVGHGLQRNCDGIPREILLLELKAQPLPGPGGFEPGI